ncbi:MAG TPA: acyl-CoA dehydrogenase [Kofleriaceae bacterium]|nr:acyl-CoA dehydrogenase [Kofleriaceae bacterium]
MANPLIADDLVALLLDGVIDLDRLLALPVFSGHTRATFDMFIATARRLARESLYPPYESMNQELPRFEDGRVSLHPAVRGLYRQVVELGILSASRPEEVGGAMLPMTVTAMASAYLMAANLGVVAIAGLTTGAARLIESFGSPELRERFMTRMYSGEWTGTMALTEPQAGSSLTDVRTTATPHADGSYRIRGTKIFISGGDQDLTENIVHLTLARIDGAPDGIKGVSLFAIPKRREEGGALVSNDVACTSVFKKIGWKALPSVQLAFGEEGDCRGWLVGEPHQGIKHMFQMMNEARLMVGMNAIASASVAYQESLQYAKDRPQGRALSARDPRAPQIPIIEHADVRRMLLRQKAIVAGGLGLLLRAAMLTDMAEHGADERARGEAKLLLDLLIPVAKTFPAEYGFESNTLAIQVHGGYGYTSEFLAEAWWRDQKLNSIHEGTSGIQAMDLLGRKAVASGGEPLRLFASTVAEEAGAAREAGLGDHAGALAAAVGDLLATTTALAMKGMSGDSEGMLRHAADYMDAFSVVAVGRELLAQATAARQGDRWSGALRDGAERTCAYWFHTELPHVAVTFARIRSGETSFADAPIESF